MNLEPQKQQPSQSSAPGRRDSATTATATTPFVERRSYKDVLLLTAVASFAVFYYLTYKPAIVPFFTRAFTEVGAEHVSLSKTELIFPFNHHVIIAVFSAAILTSIGMAMDFCLPVPADMKKKRGDQQIYIQKMIRGAVGFIIMVVEVYEVFYLGRLHVDIVWAKTPLAEFLNAFSAGFFIYEMFGLCAVFISTKRMEYPLLVHHILGVSGCFFYMKARCSYFFSCIVMIEEISAPFTFLVWMDDKRDLSHTYGAFARQVMLALVWIFLRCGVDVYLWYHALMQWNYVMSANGWWLYHFGFGFTVLTFYLNPYWLKCKLRAPILHIKFLLNGKTPQPGDISQKKEKDGTPRPKAA